MKRILLFALVCLTFSSFAQVKIYNVDADAEKDLEVAIELARKNKKQILVQIGGNWCPWCIKLHKFITENPELKKVVDENYVVVKVNYSKENKNEATLKRLDNPQRFGFPVLVILNNNGQRIHTQDSGLLESGQGYDLKKVLGFLKNWSIDAILNTSR